VNARIYYGVKAFFLSFLVIMVPIYRTLPAFAGEPDLNHNCAGDPIPPAQYAELMALLDGANNIYAQVFTAPFQYCTEPPLLLETNPRQGEYVQGYRGLENGSFEPFAFQVNRLAKFTIDEYQATQGGFDEQTVYTWHSLGITLGPVEGRLDGPQGSAEVIGLLSSGIDENGIPRAMLMVTGFTSWVPGFSLEQSEALNADVERAQNLANHDSNLPSMPKPPAGGNVLAMVNHQPNTLPPTSPCPDLNKCIADAYRYYNLQMSNASVAFQACIAGTLITFMTLYWSCLGCCGFFAVFCVAACTLGMLALSMYLTYLCVTAYDTQRQMGEMDLARDLRECSERYPCDQPTSAPAVVVF
jgi:hypothetical protein